MNFYRYSLLKILAIAKAMLVFFASTINKIYPFFYDIHYLKWYKFRLNTKSFAHIFLEQTSEDLGLKAPFINEIKRLQVFGIQVGGMWSFVQKKK